MVRTAAYFAFGGEGGLVHLSVTYGPEERRLLESTAGRLFSMAAANGRLKADDPRFEKDGEFREAQAWLTRIREGRG